MPSKSTVIFWIVIVVVIIALAESIIRPIDSAFFGTSPPGANTGQVAPSGPTALPTPAAIPNGPSALPSPNLPGPSTNAQSNDAEEKRIAEVRKRLWNASKLLTEATVFADQALAQIDKWKKEIEPLKGNDDGRLIAADEQSANQMAFLLREQRPSHAELVERRSRITELADKTDRLAAEAAPSDLPAVHSQEVEELHRQVKEASGQWTVAVERGNAILNEAKRRAVAVQVSSDPPKPVSTPAPSTSSAVSSAPTAAPPTADTPTTSGDPAPTVTPPAAPAPVAVGPPAELSAPAPAAGETLEKAVQRIDDQAKLAELERERQRQERLKAEERERQRQADIRAKEQADEHSKLVEEARSPEAQQLLQPFLTPHTVQPRLAGSSVQMSQTFDKKPISLTALKSMGALDESPRGLEVLVRIGSHRSLEGPRWSYSPSPRTWSTDTQQQLKRAQDLLRRLGPTLVAEKMLSE